MPAKVYECMVLFNSNKYAGDQAGVVKQVHSTLEKHHAEVLASRPWDERKLSYPINGNKKGTYYLIYFRSEGKNLAAIRADFALNETILRYLTLQIDPKLVDTMLALARDEHAFAMHAPGLDAEPAEVIHVPTVDLEELNK